MNSIKAFILHKEREDFFNCDDHFAANLECLNFIVADGSSSDFFSKLYSRRLCDEFAKNGLDIFDDNKIKSINNEWRNEVENELIVANCRPGSFPYVHFQRRDPGCATLIGLHIKESEDGYYYDFCALGDSVLFFIPEGECVPSMQVSSDSPADYSFDPTVEFGYTPSIASSYSTEWLEEVIKCTDRKLQKGTFYFMTDATAQWILSYAELSPDEKFKMLDDINSQEEFCEFVNKIRSLGAHMDDMTLMKVHIDDLECFKFEAKNVDLFDYRAKAEAIRNEKYNVVSNDEKLSVAENADDVVVNDESEDQQLSETIIQNNDSEKSRLDETDSPKYKDLEEKYKEILVDLSKVNGEKELLSNDNEKLKEENKRLQEELDNQRKKSQSNSETLVAAKTEVEEKFKKMESENERLQQEKKEINESFENLKIQYDEKVKEIEKLDEKYNTLRDSSLEVNSLTEQNERIQREIDEKTIENKELAQKNENLRQKFNKQKLGIFFLLTLSVVLIIILVVSLVISSTSGVSESSLVDGPDSTVMVSKELQKP